VAAAYIKQHPVTYCIPFKHQETIQSHLPIETSGSSKLLSKNSYTTRGNLMTRTGYQSREALAPLSERNDQSGQAGNRNVRKRKRVVVSGDEYGWGSREYEDKNAKRDDGEWLEDKDIVIEDDMSLGSGIQENLSEEHHAGTSRKQDDPSRNYFCNKQQMS
jgi:hypothetical protein